jgi:hypothetical protein
MGDAGEIRLQIAGIVLRTGIVSANWEVEQLNL